MEIPVLNTGQLQIALDALELARIHEEIMPNLVARGIAALPLTRRQLLAEEPLLANAVLGGLLLPTELAIEPELLMKALRTILLRGRRDGKSQLSQPRTQLPEDGGSRAMTSSGNAYVHSIGPDDSMRFSGPLARTTIISPRAMPWPAPCPMTRRANVAPSTRSSLLPVVMNGASSASSPMPWPSP